MAEVVYNGVLDENGVQGTLFNGIKFWLAQKVPQRSRFVRQVETNGGEVTKLEKQADIKIVDHARKVALPGTHSYTYIETSIRNGTLAKLEDHIVGPPEGTIRGVGSTTQPAKTTRVKFTEADDRTLWNWVQGHPQKGGGTDGNEIYKQLEAINPRHPWQSWRDRWVKQFRDTRSPFVLTNTPLTPPSDQPEANREQNTPQKRVKNGEQRKAFTKEDAEALLNLGEEIEDILPENIEAAWEKWVHDFDEENRSATEWRLFWEKTVRPIYLKKTIQNEDIMVQSTTRTQSQIIEVERQMMESQLKPSLPKETTILKSKRSPPYRPKSPLIFPRIRRDLQTLETVNDDASLTVVPPSDPSESHDEFYPSLEAQNDGCASPKRKLVDVGEFPSSSPPETKPSKRRRRENISSGVEVPSTPEKSPVQHQIESPSKTHFIVDLTGVSDVGSVDEVDDDEEFDYEEINEDELILGREPSPILSDPNPATFPTKRIIKEESPPIDYRVVPPEEGWDGFDSELKSQNEATAQETISQHPDTQALFNAETQIPEVDLPPPDGGWDDFESESESESKSQDEATTQETVSQKPDTQALFNAETQIPEVDIPPPDGGWDPHLRSSPPLGDESSLAPSPPSLSEINALLDAWIDARVEAGYSTDDAEFALQCTSMDQNLAEEVLAHMKSKGSIPENMKGVWTETDDEDLEAPDGRRITRLQRKHGSEAMDTRWRFIEAGRKCGM